MERKISTYDIVALLQLPKVGRKTALKLIQGLNRAITGMQELADYVKERAKEFRLPEYTIADFTHAYASAEWIWEQSERLGIKIISFLDAAYPAQLKDMADLPITLSYKGDIDNLTDKPNVAVIGTREPSGYGARIGERFGETFASFRFNVVSGLALGCDTAGHRGALKGKGTTAAVLAHGLDTVYPAANKGLAADILDQGGVLLSEYFVGQKSMANFFVERDRIQAGLSQSVVVVETDVKGGTMHTVRYCQDYRRRLVCFNHPVEHRNHVKAQGNQKLIREGAALPVTGKDEIEMLSFILLTDFLEKQDSNFESNLFAQHVAPYFVKQPDGTMPVVWAVYDFDGAVNPYEHVYGNLFKRIADEYSWSKETFTRMEFDHILPFEQFSQQIGTDKAIKKEFAKEIYENFAIFHLHGHLQFEIPSGSTVFSKEEAKASIVELKGAVQEPRAVYEAPEQEKAATNPATSASAPSILEKPRQIEHPVEEKKKGRNKTSKKEIVDKPAKKKAAPKDLSDKTVKAKKERKEPVQKTANAKAPKKTKPAKPKKTKPSNDANLKLWQE
jgi:DNA processing protein